MQHTTLGRTGLNVSRLCLGAMTLGWSADQATSHDILDTALENGINFFDTADIYSRWIDGHQGGESETIIGKWLKRVDRRQVVIATKVRAQMWDGSNGEGLSRHHIRYAVEDSLRRLQTDYIDLYQMHFPDDNTPLDETLHTLDDLISSGKVLYIGVSNYKAWQLMKSLWVSDKLRLVRFDCLQPHYSLFNRAEYERELADVCADQNIAVIPYSPLAAGFLTGKYTRDNQNVDTTRSGSSLIQRLASNEKAYDALDVIKAVASEHNTSTAHIALAWLLAKPTITAPIIGARTVEQLTQLIGATEVSLTENDMTRLDEATQDF